MNSPAQEHFDEVRERLEDDPTHSFADHLAAILQESEARIHPLPVDPDRMEDEDRHRWYTFIAATRFVSYAEAAAICNSSVFPQLREGIAQLRLNRELREEQVALRSTIAQAVNPAPTPAAQRMAARLEKKQREKAAAIARRGVAEAAKKSECACCAKSTPDCKCKSKTEAGCSCRLSCPECAVLHCDGLTEARNEAA
jgi:hypothetical protein